jgi:hypothetical protein
MRCGNMSRNPVGDTIRIVGVVLKLLAAFDGWKVLKRSIIS